MHLPHTSLIFTALTAFGTANALNVPPVLELPHRILDPVDIDNATFHRLYERQAPGCSLPTPEMGSSGCIMTGYDEHGCAKFDNSPACQAMMPPWRPPPQPSASSARPVPPTTIYVPVPFTAATIMTATQTQIYDITRTTMQTIYSTIPVVSFTTSTTTMTGFTIVTAQVATPTPEAGGQSGCTKVRGDGGGAVYHGAGCYEHPGCTKINMVDKDGSPFWTGTTC